MPERGITEAVHRHQLRPMLLNGAAAMDRIFASGATVTAAETGRRKRGTFLDGMCPAELVESTWQNKNRVFPVRGPDVVVAPVRRRVTSTG